MSGDVGTVVAAAFVAGVRREGADPDPALRLLAWHRAEAEAPVVCDPAELGVLHERLLAGRERTRRGVWYTPAWLAEDLVARAVDGSGPVADPACGGGAFLLAAAERLGSVEPLWGCDVDPLAVAVTEAALWWWSARRGDPVVAGDRLVVGDALTDTAIPTSAAVVGNPPFLGQLKRATAATDRRRAALRQRFGDVVRPYTDEAWLFLLAAVEAAGDRGHVALVQPWSVLGARDAAPVRAAINERAGLLDVWLDDGTAFDAEVRVCAPVLQRRRTPSSNDWQAPVVEALGVPAVQLAGGARLGDRAEVIAGFRDEYYGLTAAVDEGGDGPRLVTAGLIDPLRLRDEPVRFAKRRWQEPRVDVAVLTGRAARWADVQAGAKLLVATQSRVLEAVADPGGALLGSVPTIVVRPHDPGDLWHLAAVLHAPVVSAWMMRRAAGTALAADACKPTAGLLAEIPLPVDAAAWGIAAALAQEVSAGADRWAELAVVADAAYGVTDGTTARWWLARLPVR